MVRVGVPAERLAPEASLGFQLIGFVLPFIAMGAFFNVLSSIAFIIVVPLVIGLFMVLRSGIAKHNGVWWKNAGTQVLAGLSNGFFIALFLTLLMSCSQSMGRMGPRGWIY